MGPLFHVSSGLEVELERKTGSWSSTNLTFLYYVVVVRGENR